MTANKSGAGTESVRRLVPESSREFGQLSESGQETSPPKNCRKCFRALMGGVGHTGHLQPWSGPIAFWEIRAAIFIGLPRL
jgi:hypothetical protein